MGRTGFLPSEPFPFRLRERTAGGGYEFHPRSSLYHPLGTPWASAQQEKHPAHSAAEHADSPVAGKEPFPCHPQDMRTMTE